MSKCCPLASPCCSSTESTMEETRPRIEVLGITNGDPYLMPDVQTPKAVQASIMAESKPDKKEIDKEALPLTPKQASHSPISTALPVVKEASPKEVPKKAPPKEVPKKAPPKEVPKKAPPKEVPKKAASTEVLKEEPKKAESNILPQKVEGPPPAKKSEPDKISTPSKVLLPTTFVPWSVLDEDSRKIAKKTLPQLFSKFVSLSLSSQFSVIVKDRNSTSNHQEVKFHLNNSLQICTLKTDVPIDWISVKSFPVKSISGIFRGDQIQNQYPSTSFSSSELPYIIALQVTLPDGGPNDLFLLMPDEYHRDLFTAAIGILRIVPLIEPTVQTQIRHVPYVTCPKSDIQFSSRCFVNASTAIRFSGRPDILPELDVVNNLSKLPQRRSVSDFSSNGDEGLLGFDEANGPHDRRDIVPRHLIWNPKSDPLQDQSPPPSPTSTRAGSGDPLSQLSDSFHSNDTSKSEVPLRLPSCALAPPLSEHGMFPSWDLLQTMGFPPNETVVGTLPVNRGLLKMSEKLILQYNHLKLLSRRVAFLPLPKFDESNFDDIYPQPTPSAQEPLPFCQWKNVEYLVRRLAKGPQSPGAKYLPRQRQRKTHSDTSVDLTPPKRKTSFSCIRDSLLNDTDLDFSWSRQKMLGRVTSEPITPSKNNQSRHPLIKKTGDKSQFSNNILLLNSNDHLEMNLIRRTKLSTDELNPVMAVDSTSNEAIGSMLVDGETDGVQHSGLGKMKKKRSISLSVAPSPKTHLLKPSVYVNEVRDRQLIESTPTNRIDGKKEVCRRSRRNKNKDGVSNSLYKAHEKRRYDQPLESQPLMILRSNKELMENYDVKKNIIASDINQGEGCLMTVPKTKVPKLPELVANTVSDETPSEIRYNYNQQINKHGNNTTSKLPSTSLFDASNQSKLNVGSPRPHSCVSLTERGSPRSLIRNDTNLDETLQIGSSPSWIRREHRLSPSGSILSRIHYPLNLTRSIGSDRIGTTRTDSLRSVKTVDDLNQPSMKLTYRSQGQFTVSPHSAGYGNIITPGEVEAASPFKRALSRFNSGNVSTVSKTSSRMYQNKSPSFLACSKERNLIDTSKGLSVPENIPSIDINKASSSVSYSTIGTKFSMYSDGPSIEELLTDHSSDSIRPKAVKILRKFSRDEHLKTIDQSLSEKPSIPKLPSIFGRPPPGKTMAASKSDMEKLDAENMKRKAEMKSLVYKKTALSELISMDTTKMLPKQ